MGLFTPKYPKSDTPGTGQTHQPTRRERRQAERESQPARLADVGSATEADLAEWERQGMRVDRHTKVINVTRTNKWGATESRGFYRRRDGSYGPNLGPDSL